MDEPFTVTARARSFRHAFRGIGTMLRSQHNAWIHAVATVAVVVAGFALGVSAIEWCVLVLTIIAVWTAEALNTAFEFLCNVASPEFHPLVEKSKDVSAGAVLITAMGAVIVAAIVLGPKLLMVFAWTG